MLRDDLKNYKIILASGSPRRQAFIKELGLSFEIRLKSVNEVYPEELAREEISDFLCQLKSEPFLSELDNNDILITSDTIVWHNKKGLGKPGTKEEAYEMLQSLSASTHDVITSVCLSTSKKQLVFHDATKVKFRKLSHEEIQYYIDTYQPYDKAGAYGIQEWIGAIAITEIKGSYNNVVGLPTQKLYETLKDFIKGL